jgi:hypothetical protein
VKYHSPIYGDVDWPWWHDAIICGIAVGLIWIFFGPIPPDVWVALGLIFVLSEHGHWHDKKPRKPDTVRMNFGREIDPGFHSYPTSYPGKAHAANEATLAECPEADREQIRSYINSHGGALVLRVGGLLGSEAKRSMLNYHKLHGELPEYDMVWVQG